MTIDILTNKTVSDINAEIFKAIHMPIKRVRPSLIRVTCDADEETRAAALKAIAYVFGKSVSVSIDRAAPVTIAALTAPAKMPRRSRKRHKEAATRPVKPEMVNGAIYGAGFIIPTSSPAPVPTAEVHEHVKASIGGGNPLKEWAAMERKRDRLKDDEIFKLVEECGADVVRAFLEDEARAMGIYDAPTAERFRERVKEMEYFGEVDDRPAAYALLAERVII